MPVYFKEKGTYTFETYNLTGEGIDTTLEIFKVNYTGPTTSTLGGRVGYSDNVCAWLYRYDCLASSVAIAVPDDSWYVARITNNDYNTDRSLNDYNIVNRPGYDFHIWK